MCPYYHFKVIRAYLCRCKNPSFSAEGDQRIVDNKSPCLNKHVLESIVVEVGMFIHKGSNIT